MQSNLLKESVAHDNFFIREATEDTGLPHLPENILTEASP